MPVYLKEIHRFRRCAEADGSPNGIPSTRSLVPTFRDICFLECILRESLVLLIFLQTTL